MDQHWQGREQRLLFKPSGWLRDDQDSGTPADTAIAHEHAEEPARHRDPFMHKQEVVATVPDLRHQCSLR